MAPRILQSLRGQKEQVAQGTAVTPRAQPWHHDPGQEMWLRSPKPTENCCSWAEPGTPSFWHMACFFWEQGNMELGWLRTKHLHLWSISGVFQSHKAGAAPEKHPEVPNRGGKLLPLAPSEWVVVEQTPATTQQDHRVLNKPMGAKTEPSSSPGGGTKAKRDKADFMRSPESGMESQEGTPEHGGSAVPLPNPHIHPDPPDF